MNEFDQFEQRLAASIRSDADASVGPFEAEPIARAAIAGTQRRATRLPRASSGRTGRFGRGRGITLLAAAALLLVGGALVAGSGVLRLPSIVPPVPAPSFGVVATASPDATSPSPSHLAGPSASPTSSAFPGSTGVWIATGPMGTPRYGFTAVRLVDGRVLVAGGTNSGSSRGKDLTSAELYDPASGTWTATGNMVSGAGLDMATLLRDGKVLGVGGNGAEVYDPASGTWTTTGKMVGDAGNGTATLLRDGKVLVAGNGVAQLYDPASGTWTATGKMTTPRYNHTATLLPDGRVLAAGGDVPPDRIVDSAELYDPDTGSWTAIANTRFDGSPATLLQDGTVLFLRGSTPALYDPATGTWTPTGNMARSAAGYSMATRLLDGTVLVAGGGAELYNPATKSWTKTGSMLFGGGSATLLLDGTVLVTGGSNGTGATSSAELYIPAGTSPPPDLAVVPSPTPTLTPTPRPTPFPPEAGPVPAGARTWKVTVVNKSADPATLFLAEEGANGMGQLCGSVTPNVVRAGVTTKVTFLLPPKSVTSCWVWVNPPTTGDLFQTSDAPMAGEFIVQENEGGVQGGWLSP